MREAWSIALCGSRVSPNPEIWPGGWPVEKPRYAADGVPLGTATTRSPIFMPRWASRITLEVTDVRVQRLQEISEDDARAEGCQPVTHDDGTVDCGTRKATFAALWESIHGAGSWDANPWVWALTFRRVRP